MGETGSNEEVRTAVNKSSDRLYNPRLRTSVSREIWNRAPSFFKEHADQLKFAVGSDNLVVSLHGSTLLGVATEGIHHPTEPKWEFSPSDVDVSVYAGEKDKYETRYQEKYGQVDSEYKNLPEFLEDERLYRFEKEANPKDVFGRRFDGMIVRMPELLSQLKITCKKAMTESEGRKFSNQDLFAAYNSMMLLVTNPIYQSNESLTDRFKDQVLDVILTTPGGKIVWDQLMRPYFRKYMVNYEDNVLGALPTAQGGHKKRVGMAFEEILALRGVDQPNSDRVINFLRKQRSDIQLPAFDELKAMTGKSA